jgi:hypothetical protein
MQDYSITGLTVNDVASVNAALQPTTLKHVTFYVGRRGPFYLDFTQADYNHDAVITAILAQVNTLKKIDAGLEVQ